MTSISTQFQRMLVSSQVEEAVINVLVKWFPTYLHEVERQTGMEIDTIIAPRNYTNRNSFDMIPAEELPKVVVISPGTNGTPTSRGNGAYTASWDIGVGVVHAAPNEAEGNLLSKCYAAAVRGMLLQQAGDIGDELFGIAQIIWNSERYQDLTIANQSQLLKAAGIYFIVDISNVVSKWGGPDVPDLPPEDYDYPDVEHVTITLNKVPLADEIPVTDTDS